MSSTLFLFYGIACRTGEVRWQERLGGRHRASLVLAGGRLYATDDADVTTVFEASPERYLQVARNEIGELAYAAVADGRISIRTNRRLHALGECAAAAKASAAAAPSRAAGAVAR